MMDRNQTWRIAPRALGVAALLLCGLAPNRADVQQAVPIVPALPSDPPQDMAPLFDDPHEATRKGLLFYAVSPRTEKDLSRLGATSAPFSATIPIEVDWANSRVHVAADIDGRKARLILDTGGGPMVALNGFVGKGLKLEGQFSDTMSGIQGEEPVTIGLAHRMTLGLLTLGAVNVAIDHDPSPVDDCTMGLEIFQNYRVTLDFAAKTMTLVRGGVSAASANDTSLSVPFREDGGNLYIPVRVLDRSVWAMLDTGSDGNEMSLSLAKSAAARFPEAGSKELTLSGKVGAGDPKNKVTALVLGVPLPISLDTEQADAMPDGFRFGTTSQAGASFLEEPSDSSHSLVAPVKLGLPFFLQFRRVIIDYPNHVLILQQPQHGAALFAPVGAKVPSKAWPGYEWRRVGDGWLEASIQKVTPPAAPAMTAGAHVTVHGGPPDVVISLTDNRVITVTVKGVSKTYYCLPGSAVEVSADGSVHVTPPASASPPAVVPGG